MHAELELEARVVLVIGSGYALSCLELKGMLNVATNRGGFGHWKARGGAGYWRGGAVGCSR